MDTFFSIKLVMASQSDRSSSSCVSKWNYLSPGLPIVLEWENIPKIMFLTHNDTMKIVCFWFIFAGTKWAVTISETISKIVRATRGCVYRGTGTSVRKPKTKLNDLVVWLGGALYACVRKIIKHFNLTHYNKLRLTLNSVDYYFIALNHNIPSGTGPDRDLGNILGFKY